MAAPPLLDDERLLELLDAGFEYGMTRTVGELVDVEQILRVLDTVSDPARAPNLLARFVAPSRVRLVATLEKSELALRAWLPEPVIHALSAWLGQPVRVPKRIIDEVVTSERVRDAVKQMLEESMRSVIQRALKAAPGGRGLRGIASLAGAAGRGIFGGFGEEVQRLLEERLHDFLDVGVGLVQNRLAQRLASEDTAKLLGVRRRQAFEEALKAKERDVGEALAGVPWDLVEAMVPAIASHNLARAPLREALTVEIRHALEELSRSEVGPLLDALGLREQVRELVRSRGLPLIRGFLRSPAWTSWLARSLVGS